MAIYFSHKLIWGDDKMKKLGIALTVCLLASFFLVGCSNTNEMVEEQKETVEQKMDEMADKGKAAVNQIVDEVKSGAQRLEEDLQIKGKATLEAVEENGNTLKYKFVAAKDSAAMETKEIEEKVAKMDGEIKQRLTDLKNKGVENAKVVVEFVDKEGKQLYSKVFE